MPEEARRALLALRTASLEALEEPTPEVNRHCRRATLALVEHHLGRLPRALEFIEQLRSGSRAGSS